MENQSMRLRIRNVRIFLAAKMNWKSHLRVSTRTTSMPLRIFHLCLSDVDFRDIELLKCRSFAVSHMWVMIQLKEIILLRWLPIPQVHRQGNTWPGLQGETGGDRRDYSTIRSSVGQRKLLKERLLNVYFDRLNDMMTVEPDGDEESDAEDWTSAYGW